MKRIIKIRDEFSIGLDKVLRQNEKSAWDFYINSTPETMKQYEIAQDEYTKLFSNKKQYFLFRKPYRHPVLLHRDDAAGLFVFALR